MITDTVERAVLLWLLRSGSTGSHGLDLQPVTAVTTIQTLLNSGPLAKTSQETFQLYGYCGEEEEKKKLPSLTVICPTANPVREEPGNYVVDVEVEYKSNATSRPDVENDPESDVITLAEKVGRWLESVLSQPDDDIVDQINSGHEWCTVMLIPQRPTWTRFVEKSVRGHRATFQLHASLSNYR